MKSGLIALAIASTGYAAAVKRDQSTWADVTSELPPQDYARALY
jgi:hypothetical protein